MEPYPKIRNLFKRDPNTKYKTVLYGEYTLPEFEYLTNNRWVFTEKVDGTNIRVMSFPSGDVVFGGRTNNAQLPAKLVQRLGELFPPHSKLHNQFPDGACLYGEGYGAGIQKGGGNYSATQEFVLFDIRVGDYWLDRETLHDITNSLDIAIVPIVGSGTLTDAVKFVKDCSRSCWGNFQAEGIILYPEVQLFDRTNHRIIAKSKCKDFG